MPNREFFVYLLILAGSTYLIRAIPFAAVRKRITNPFLRSFLYYIPYTVLGAMTFPAALYATGNIMAAAAGILVAVIFAVKEKGLTLVALASCITVFIVEWLISIL